MITTIYNTYVEMDSQEQCDRMQQLCIDNELPFSKDLIAFEYNSEWGYAFKLAKFGEFGVYEKDNLSCKITEQEFIELLESRKLQREKNFPEIHSKLE